MNTFTSIKELLSTLVREHKLLTEMFEKRKTLSYKYDLALVMVDYNEERIQYLISHSVIRQNRSFYLRGLCLHKSSIILPVYRRSISANESFSYQQYISQSLRLGFDFDKQYRPLSCRGAIEYLAF